MKGHIFKPVEGLILMNTISAELHALARDPSRLSTILKGFEVNKDTKVTAGQPVIIKLDGNNFGKFTKGLKKPQDLRLKACMVETTKALVRYWGASCGYTHSDEIVIVLENNISYKDINLASVPFSGKVSKLLSLSAAKSSVFFNALLHEHLPEKIPSNLEDRPCLISSVYSVPNLAWALLWLAWRQAECVKNTVDSAMSNYYAHSQIEGKSTKQKLDLLKSKGFDFESQDAGLQYGTFILKKKSEKEFSAEELKNIPEDKRPSGPVLRTSLEELHLPKLLELTDSSDIVFNPLYPVR